MQNASPETPRVLAGLTAGRIVLFVLANFTARPLLITDAGDGTGSVDGVVFLTRQDRGHHPGSAYEPVNVLPVENIPFEEPDPVLGLKPFTWHWPKREPVVAASVDAAALETSFEALFVPREKRLLDTISELLDSHSNMIQGVVGTLQAKMQAPAAVASGDSFRSGLGSVSPAVSSPEQVNMTGATGDQSPNPSPASKESPDGDKPTDAEVHESIANQVDELGGEDGVLVAPEGATREQVDNAIAAVKADLTDAATVDAENSSPTPKTAS